MKKKIINHIMLFFMVLNIIHFSHMTIKANTNKPVIVKTKYYLGNSNKGYINQGFHVYLNNETVFCIDPYAFIDRNAQYHADGKAKDIDMQIQRIAYFGYYYPKSINDPRFISDPDKFYINTQAMIWEHKGVDVKVSTNNYDQFKKEVNFHLKNYDQQVSFSNKKIKIDQAQVFLKDNNNVLKYYNVINNNKNILLSKINNNILKITVKDFNNFKNININSLYKYKPSSKINIIYKANNSQTLSKLGYVNSIFTNFEIINNTKLVRFNKIDNLTNKAISGAKFSIYDEKGIKITDFVSTLNGVKLRLVKDKKYIIKEAEVKGYEKFKPIEFIIKDDTNDITLVNNRLKKDILFEKKDDNNHFVVGAHLVLYHNDKIVDKWISGNNSKNLKNLIYGENYRLSELKAPDGYDYADDIKFKVTDNKMLKMIDYKIKGEIVINKKDVQGNKLSGSEFKLIDLNTHKIVKKVSENEKIKNLDVTHQYELIEVKAPKGYQLGHWVNNHLVNSTKISFDWRKVQDKNLSNNILTKVVDVYDDKLNLKKDIELVNCGDNQTNLFISNIFNSFIGAFQLC